MSRRYSIWHKLVALAPLLVVGVYLPAETMLRCRFDGLLRPACCCPHQDEAPDPGPVAKAQDCCAPELATSDRPVVEVARKSSADVVWASAIGLPAAVAWSCLAPSDHLVRGWQAQAPPRDGPPLVLLKRSFLI